MERKTNSHFLLTKNPRSKISHILVAALVATAVSGEIRTQASTEVHQVDVVLSQIEDFRFNE